MPLANFFFISVILFHISAINNLNKIEEHLLLKNTSYRVVNNKAQVQITFQNNVWYQDSVGITQLTGLGVGDTESRDSIYTIPLGYRFVDMRKNLVYEYNSLSDTATIIKKFANPDRVGLPGGWGFFRRSLIKFDSIRFLNDSIINGVNYKKYQYIKEFNGVKLLSEMITRCDRKGTLFHLDVGLSNAVGCPVVKSTTMTIDGKFPSSSVEIEYISNSIPDSVKKVFQAWKRNVDLYPIQ